MNNVCKSLVLMSLLATPLAAEQVTSAPGGVLRVLDKTSSHTTDLEMISGQSANVGNLQIVMSECRYPVGNPAGNAYAELEISEKGKEGTVFSGWMIASAPALSAMEHRRYDIWVMRCTTS